MKLFVLILIVILIVLALAMLSRRRRTRRNALREQFGPEYDRTVQDSSRRKAEQDLRSRMDRRAELEIHSLPPASVNRYRDEWHAIQEQFVDAPADAVAAAHTLLTSAMGERGYPTREQDERMALLSVDHADVVQRYRKAASIEQAWRTRGEADTEDLRQAMQHYRAVFDEVIGSGTTTVPESRATPPDAAH